MRSYADQGLDLEPTQHMGPATAAMEQKEPGSTRIGRENQARIERNKVREMFAQSQAADQIHIDRLVIEISDLADEIETAKQDLAKQESPKQPSPERVAQLIRSHLEKNPPSPDQGIEDWKADRWGHIKTWAGRIGEQTLKVAGLEFTLQFDVVAAAVRVERAKLRESLKTNPSEPENPHQGDLRLFEDLFDDDDPDTDYDRPG